MYLHIYSFVQLFFKIFFYITYTNIFKQIYSTHTWDPKTYLMYIYLPTCRHKNDVKQDNF